MIGTLTAFRGVRDAFLRRNQRLQLQGMEGDFLSRQTASEANVELLRPAVFDGGSEQYVLPDAQGRCSAVLGRTSGGHFSLRAQGIAENHTFQTAQGRRA